MNKIEIVVDEAAKASSSEMTRQRYRNLHHCSQALRFGVPHNAEERSTQPNEYAAPRYARDWPLRAFDLAITSNHKTGSAEARLSKGETMMTYKAAWRTAATRAASASVLALALAGALGNEAMAQTAADPGAAAATGIQEVIVTASRREESAQKAALALAVVGGAQIESQGISQPENLNKLVPGLKMTNGNVTSIYIRGVGENSTNPNTQSAVAFSVDGVYVGRTTAVSGNFFDVQRIEVLKGPQGTLYGRNASGGAINLITNKPTPDFGGSLSLEGGDYNLRRAQGFLNAPISDTLALRAAFYVSKRDGYNTDGSQDEDLTAGRLHLLWTPNEKAKLLLTADASKLGGIGNGTVFLGTDREGVNPTGAYAQQLRKQLTRVLPDFIGLGLNYKNRSVSAQLDYDLGFATMTLQSGWRGQDFHLVNRGFPGGGRYTNGEAGQYTNEARLAHTGERLKYVLGLYSFIENVSYTDELLQFQGTAIVHPIQDVRKFDTNSKAAFGEATYSVVEKLRLTLGLRYTNEKRSFDNRYTTYGTPYIPRAGTPFTTRVDPLLGGAPTGYYAYDNIASPIFKSTTGKLGVEYDVTPTSMLWASAATGFKSGGFSLTAPPTNVYQPEKLTAYTIGSKNRFFDNRLQLNLEVFKWQYRNQQVSHLAFDLYGANAFLTENAGLSEIKGASLDVRWQPTVADTFTFAVERLDTVYKEYITIVPSVDVLGCKFTPIVFQGRNVQQQDCSGFPLPYAPKYSGTVGYSHMFNLGALGSLTPNLIAQFASKQRLAIDARPQFQGKSYISPDADITYRTADGKWSVSAWVRNINDAEIYNSVTTMIVGPTTYFTGDLRPPRTYGVRLNARF